MPALTVATWNVHWGVRTRTHEPFDVVGTCRRLDADVLALQEVWRPDGERSVADEVAAAMGYEVHHAWTARGDTQPRPRIVARTGDGAGSGDWGQALLTRVPRRAVAEHRLDAFLFDPSDRAVLTTEVDVDGACLTVCASHFPHLEHFSPLLRWRLRGLLPDPRGPAVLMGDFNMWRWVTRFVVPGWRDTARGRTWPARRPTFQIDHLLATPSVGVVESEVLPIGGSDHFPLRARLTIPPEPPPAPGPRR